MTKINSIRCCGFDEAYDALMKSRNGCLNDDMLYSSALFSYQTSVLASYVEDVCLTKKQYSDAYQKALLECSCCMKDIESPKKYEPVCDDMYIISFTDNSYNSFYGWTLNGFPEYDWSSLAASFGGTYILDFAATAPFGSPQSQATFMYQGSIPPPDLTGTDVDLNPVSFSFTKYCKKSVFQFWTPSGTLWPFNNTIKIGDININLLLYGVLNATNVNASIAAMNSALQTYFGPDAFATLCPLGESNPNGVIGTIDFHNVYGYEAWSGGFQLYLEFNASDFDYDTYDSLTVSDIGYDSGTMLYKYAVTKPNFITPLSITTFFLNYRFTWALKVQMNPGLAFGFVLADASFPFCPNGYITPDPWPIVFLTNGDTIFNLPPFQPVERFGISLPNPIAIDPNPYIHFAVQQNPLPINSTVYILNPYKGNSYITSFNMLVT